MDVSGGAFAVAGVSDDGRRDDGAPQRQALIDASQRRAASTRRADARHSTCPSIPFNLPDTLALR